MGTPATWSVFRGEDTRSQLKPKVMAGSKLPEGPMLTAPPPPVMPPAEPRPPAVLAALTPAPIAPAVSPPGTNAPGNPRAA